ncbi:MAG: type II toxin-antitoxin system VapC family toxin [Acidimicrobiales bacterium]
MLLPEVLTKPTRDGTDDEVAALAALLARLDLRPVDEAIASLAVALGASYGSRPADAVHLATAVSACADRFITNNRRDFSQSIEEVSVTYPTDLP